MGSIIIEGIDRLGKSTLVDGIVNQLGYHTKIHLGKPEVLDIYKDLLVDPLKLYQQKTFHNMFKMIDSGADLIFDRGHLGEHVYAPLYRKYDTSYIYGLEKNCTGNVTLILLVTNNFDICIDDGDSFNFNNKKTEQSRFIDAYWASTIQNKHVIWVNDGDNFKSHTAILKEACTYL